MEDNQTQFNDTAWSIVEKHTGINFNHPGILFVNSDLVQSQGDQHSVTVPIPNSLDISSHFMEYNFLFITWYKRRFKIDRVIALDEQLPPLLVEINDDCISALKDFLESMNTVNT